MHTIRLIFILFIGLNANDVTLKGHFKKNSAISITQIVNHESNEKKVIRKVELADGVLDIQLNISETCQLELYGNNGNQALGTSYIYVEKGGSYTLYVDESGARGFKVKNEENSRLNTVYRTVENDYLKLVQQFTPDFGNVDFWQNKVVDVLNAHKVEKGSYLEKLITYLYANTELSIPVKFALKSNDIEKAKLLLQAFEKKYYSGNKENIPTYYMTRSSLKRLKRKMGL